MNGIGDHSADDQFPEDHGAVEGERPFRELDPNRREEIDASGLRLEYESVSSAIGAAKSTFAAEMDRLDPPLLASDLIAALPSRPAGSMRRTGARFAALRIPLWPVATAAITAAVAILALWPSDRIERRRDRVVYVEAPARADTRLEAALARADSLQHLLRSDRDGFGERVVYRDRLVVRKAAAPVSNIRPMALADGTPAPDSSRFVGLANIPRAVSEPRGRSLAEDSAYRKFGFSGGGRF